MIPIVDLLISDKCRRKRHIMGNIKPYSKFNPRITFIPLDKTLLPVYRVILIDFFKFRNQIKFKEIKLLYRMRRFYLIESFYHSFINRIELRVHTNSSTL